MLGIQSLTRLGAGIVRKLMVLKDLMREKILFTVVERYLTQRDCAQHVIFGKRRRGTFTQLPQSTTDYTRPRLINAHHKCRAHHL